MTIRSFIAGIALSLSGCLAIPHLDHRSPQVSGRVLDAGTNGPIRDARVEFVENPALAVLTDANGEFVIGATKKPELFVPIGNTDAYDIGQNIEPRLRISCDGYKSIEIDAIKEGEFDWRQYEPGKPAPHPKQGPFRLSSISLERL